MSEQIEAAAETAVEPVEEQKSGVGAGGVIVGAAAGTGALYGLDKHYKNKFVEEKYDLKPKKEADVKAETKPLDEKAQKAAEEKATKAAEEKIKVTEKHDKIVKDILEKDSAKTLKADLELQSRGANNGLGLVENHAGEVEHVVFEKAGKVNVAKVTPKQTHFDALASEGVIDVATAKAKGLHDVKFDGTKLIEGHYKIEAAELPAGAKHGEKLVGEAVHNLNKVADGAKEGTKAFTTTLRETLTNEAKLIESKVVSKIAPLGTGFKAGGALPKTLIIGGTVIALGIGMKVGSSLFDGKKSHAADNATQDPAAGKSYADRVAAERGASQGVAVGV